MRRSDLMQKRDVVTVEELEFRAKLAAYLDRHEANWEADDQRCGRPPTRDERNNRAMWQNMIEEQAWDQFYGVADECGEGR
jgi:hypothetical protein